MPAVAGYQGLCKIATSASPTTSIGQLKEATLSKEMDMEETSIMGDRAKDFLPTLYGAELSLACNLDLTDSVQTVVQNAFFAGTLLYFIFSPNNGTNTWTFTGYISSLEVGDPVDGVVSLDISVQVTGTIVAA